MTVSRDFHQDRSVCGKKKLVSFSIIVVRDEATESKLWSTTCRDSNLYSLYLQTDESPMHFALES